MPKLSEMKAGRELDALVAEKVMGLSKGGTDVNGVFVYLDHIEGGIWTAVPNYSTDIAAAWEVLCKMGEIGFGHLIELSPQKLHNVGFKNIKTGIFYSSMQSKTTSHGICLAALKAVGHD